MIMALRRESVVVWASVLHGAFRTGLACFLAGLVMQQGSMHTRWVTFPLFAYVVAVSVVWESTFGKAFQDTVGVVAGSVQGVGLPMLVLHWLIPPRDISIGVAVACISATSLLFTYGLGPARLRCILYSDNILAKRVALAHSAIIYLNALSQKEGMEEVLFSLRLACTTIIGATCGMLALLLPVPHLAFFQSRREIELFGRITSLQIKATVGAFCTDDPYVSSAMRFQSNSLGELGAKVCDELRSKERDVVWEARRLSCGSASPDAQSTVKALVSTVCDDIMGMELAITSAATASTSKLLSPMIPEKLKDNLVCLADWVSLAIIASVDSQKSIKWGLSVNPHPQDQVESPKTRYQTIIEQGMEGLSSFDHEMTEFLISKTRTGIAGEGESVHDAIDWSEEELATHFFLYNVRHAAKKTMNYLCSAVMGIDDPPRKSFSAIADINQVQLPANSCTKSNLEVHLSVADDHNHDMPGVRANPDEVPSTAGAVPVPAPARDLHQYRFCPTWSWKWIYKLMRLSTRCRALRRMLNLNSEQLRAALKMALAMAMGAFLGFWFDEPKASWADITVALNYMGPSKAGSFKEPVLRSFGTAAGATYGLLAALATHSLPTTARLMALLPWVIFTSFLRQSKVFGMAGAVSAFTGAVFVLTRTWVPSSASSPSLLSSESHSIDRDFTVVRIVEVFIGMASFLLIELLIFPRRAARLVKVDAIAGLANLKTLSLAILSAFATCASDADSPRHVSPCLHPSCTGLHQNCIRSTVRNLRAAENTIASDLSRQRMLVNEAVDEPQFWFAYFPSRLFSNLIAVQTRLLDYLRFTISAYEDIYIERASIMTNNTDHHLREPLMQAMQITIQDKLVPILTFLIEVMHQPVLPQNNSCTTNDSSRNIVNVDFPTAAAGSEKCNLAHAFHQAAGTVIAKTSLSSPLKLDEQVNHPNDQCTSSDTSLRDKPSQHPLLFPSTKVLVSLLVLQFALKGILHTAKELQSTVQELLQEQDPWRLINFHVFYSHVLPKNQVQC